MVAGEVVVEEFGRFVADVEARRERFARMRAEADEVTVRETSAGGGVTVTVNSTGNMTGLDIDPGTAPPVDRIADEILATMRRAQGRLAARVGDVVRYNLADDTDTVNRVTEAYRSRFPEPVDDSAEPRTAAPAGDSDDEGYDSPLW
jgi:DNA-binding protein YbaB